MNFDLLYIYILLYIKIPLLFSWDTLSLASSPLEKSPASLSLILEDLQSGLTSLSSHTHKILFSTPNLFFPHWIVKELVKRLKLGMDLGGINLERQSHLDRIQLFTDIIETLECSKCEWIDWSEAFCDGEMCQAFDPNSK